MASAAITPNPQPLATTSNSRQNLPSSRPFSATAGTHPESQAPHSNMSFSMSQGSQGSGLMPQSSFRQYDAGNNGVNRRDNAPQIYSAVYSGVDVYEMEVNNVAVMRRRKDSWLNATQILKVAGIEKGKRTKVLEKEILIGEHEKVQGGYGKYQGTWIKFDRGLEFCRQYGVEEILRPLLTYDMGHGIEGRGGIDTPTKEQAMAANRKRMYSSQENRSGGQSGTFFKNISSTASHAVAAISKARFDSPVPRKNGASNTRPASFSRQSSSQQEASYPAGSQQSMQSFASNESFGANGQDSAYATQYSHHGLPDDTRNGDFEEPPRKRVRPSPSENDPQQTDGYYNMSMRDGSPTEPSESFAYHAQRLQGDGVNSPLLPLEEANIPDVDRKKRLLMTLFVEPAQSDYTNREVFRELSAQDLDIPIDTASNTPLIWAATLARIPLLKALVAAGASPNRVNRNGETALMRACSVTNNLDMGTFTDILELLSSTINFTDSRNRTVLHHIAITSAVKGRSSASKYYLESLLEFVVRAGTAPNSQSSFGNGALPVDSMNLGRFMSEVVNIQDRAGDTALNIAARIGNASIINQLLEVGADNKLRNNSGLAPYDFNIGDRPNVEPQSARIPAPDRYISRTKESSTEIISSISSLVSEAENEFAREMETKQARIEKLHTELRDSSAKLGEQRRQVESLEAKAAEQSTRKLKIANLTRAVNEQRAKLQEMQRRMGQVNGEVDMQLGDADKGLALPAGSAPANVLASINPNPHQTSTLDQAQRQMLNSLPPTHVLRARVIAYKANNAELEEEVRGLEGKSSELAGKYRKIISLCTGTDNVDELAEALVRATESDADVELPRIRDFLQRVDGSS